MNVGRSDGGMGRKTKKGGEDGENGALLLLTSMTRDGGCFMLYER